MNFGSEVTEDIDAGKTKFLSKGHHSNDLELI